VSTPPAHVRAFRASLVVLVLLVVLVALWQAPWDGIVAALDPWVDGLRRQVYP
jgi:hypothetical protein